MKPTRTKHRAKQRSDDEKDAKSAAKERLSEEMETAEAPEAKEVSRLTSGIIYSGAFSSTEAYMTSETRKTFLPASEEGTRNTQRHRVQRRSFVSAFKSLHFVSAKCFDLNSRL